MKTTKIRGIVLTVVTALCAALMAALMSSTATAATSTASSHSGLQCRSHYAATHGPSGKVNVPASYCYDPDTTTHNGWHDYCSAGAPDSYGSADFRGPCARHDMCLSSGHSHNTCDGPLLTDLKHNCDFAYGTFNPTRYTCRARAYVYYKAIRIFTN